MGCASSKVLGSEFAAEKGSMAFSRGISLPTPHQVCADDFHIVALTSSTYGILKVDPIKPPEEETKDSLGSQSVKEVLSKLNNLESKAEAGPQSWLEVSSMLENLKPGLEKNTTSTNKLGQLSKPKQPDAIDINEIMRDLDDVTGLIKAKVANPALVSKASLKKANKPFDKSMPIHTLEELDECLGGKENHVKQGSLAGANPKGLPKTLPNGVINDSGKATTDSISKATKGMPKGDDEKAILAPRNGVISKDSALFDAEFLGSYKKTLTNLSADDWKSVEAHEEAGSEQQQSPKADEKAAQERPEAEAKEGKQAQLVCPKSELMGSKQAQVDELLPKSEESPLNQQGEVLPKPTASTKTAAAKPSPLESFEKICPPGGEHTVVIYTTSLRGIRKTYEDCNKVKGIVESFGVAMDERDVSMHLEYRNELRELMERVVTVPRLFIKGRYIGGAEEISKLLEEGKLAGLFEGSPINHSTGKACDGCGGARFVPCFECSGSRKVVNEEKKVIRCSDCNENGLTQCPICC